MVSVGRKGCIRQSGRRRRRPRSLREFLYPCLCQLSGMEMLLARTPIATIPERRLRQLTRRE